MNDKRISEEVLKRDYSILNEGCSFPQTRHKVYVNNWTGINTGGGSNGLDQTIRLYWYDQVMNEDQGWRELESRAESRARTTCVRPGGSRTIKFDLYKTRNDGNHLVIANEIAKTQSTDVSEDSHSWSWRIVTEAIEDNGLKVVVYLQWTIIVGDQPVNQHKILNKFTEEEWLTS